MTRKEIEVSLIAAAFRSIGHDVLCWYDRGETRLAGAYDLEQSRPLSYMEPLEIDGGWAAVAYPGGIESKGATLELADMVRAMAELRRDNAGDGPTGPWAG